MYEERPIIPRTTPNMKMGIGMENGTIRLVIDTTRQRICCMRAATATTD
jgi:hypothetical protein